MPQSGRVVFSQMEEVLFGQPAAQAVAELAKDAQRVFLMVSGTLRRETDEIDKVRRALGNRCVGVFDRMPAHTPRTAVIAAAEQAREARADLIVTIGGGSITDGAKAVQLCLANDVRTPEALDALRPVNGAPPPCNAPSVRQVTVPTTLSAGEFSAIAGVTDERHKVKELFRHPRIIPRAVILDPAITVHTPEWLFLSTGIRAVDHCVEGICSNEAHPFADAQALRGLALLARGTAAGEGGSIRSAGAAGLSVGVLAVDGTAGERRADGCQPRHRLRAGRGVRHSARAHVVHHAAGGDAVEQAGQRREAGAGGGGDGPSGRGCRRCAGRVHRRAWHAAEFECGECRGGCVRADGGTGDGHAMGATQSAAHRWAGAGEGDFGAGGMTRFQQSGK